ncbi:MAG TPA: caspase family protein, partial [Pyrinomonadaceae bacterium]|nr:caspase family protein [Pyrinomonadaceae bacterium]
TLKVKVSSRTKCPIKSVLVLLNGATRGNISGDPSDREGSRQMQFEMRIKLNEGANSLHIIASNELASSKSQAINLTYVPPDGGGGPPDELKSKSPKLKEPRPGELRPKQPAPLPQPTPDAERVSFRPASFVAAPPAARRAPPAVNILSPAEPVTTTNNKNLILRVEAFSEAPPTDLEVKLNGERVNFLRINSTGTLSTLTVGLDPGENEVTVTAFNGDEATGVAASEPVTRKVIYKETLRKLVFLGIGVSTYEVYRPPLLYAADDARDLAALLSRQKDGPNPYFDDVKTAVLANDEVKRDDIIEKLDWLNKEASGSDDVRVVLISGHAGLTPGGYYFFSHTYRSDRNPEHDNIAADTFWRLLSQNNTKLIFLVDTCRAGGAAPRDFIKNVTLSNAVFIGSSSADQPSKEDTEARHGYLTWAAIEGLGGKAEDDGDGLISDEELVFYVKKEVRRLTSRQQEPVSVEASELPPFTVASCPNRTCPRGNP